MTTIDSGLSTLSLHLTNVTGYGACQLMLSLLPALERNEGAQIIEIRLPERGALSKYKTLSPGIRSTLYHRYLPNAISRFIECFFPGKFLESSKLIVFGDLPLRCRSTQVLFVQTPHLLKPKSFHINFRQFKFFVMRLVFRINLRYVKAFIVQTAYMKEELAVSYPAIAKKIHIISQPVPNWLIDNTSARTCRKFDHLAPLNLIYPAADYFHKNHKLLSKIYQVENLSWPIHNLILTLDADSHPAPHIEWIKCVGYLLPDQMVKAYDVVDGLVFLSTTESYGFPIVEAMFRGLPIVCPDLPYARQLCGLGAFYFDPYSIYSFNKAIETLHRRLSEGWWPDWSSQLSAIPENWDFVAANIIKIASNNL
jgi:glycosyltransferase involved in cell wall biosynthesis